MKKRSDLVKQIMASMRAIKRHLQQLKKHPTNITPAQWEILNEVLCHPGQSTKDLAKKLGMTNSGITQHVNLLVEKKLLKRQEDREDRRQIHIEATPSFQKKSEKMHKAFCERISGLFETLTTRELEVFAKLHDKISHHLIHPSHD